MHEGTLRLPVKPKGVYNAVNLKTVAAGANGVHYMI
jgi:hypothetical protein